MTTSGPRLLTPPQEREERYPYSPVWRSFVLESSILAAITVIAFVAITILGISIPSQLTLFVTVLVALLPALVWAIVSTLSERNALEPRQGFIMLFVISAIAANAISLPLIDRVLEVDKWLPLSSAVYRILGYTVTVGIVQETTKYLVLRYMVWPQNLRVRVDTVAFALATGIAYATVLNLDFIIRNDPVALDVIALRSFANYALNVSGSLIIAYGLAELRFSDPFPFFMMFILAVAALITGIAIPIRTGLVSASFSLNTPTPRPLLGLGFSFVLLIVVSLIVSTLINSAERRAQEARLGREE